MKKIRFKIKAFVGFECDTCKGEGYMKDNNELLSICPNCEKGLRHPRWLSRKRALEELKKALENGEEIN